MTPIREKIDELCKAVDAASPAPWGYYTYGGEDHSRADNRCCDIGHGPKFMDTIISRDSGVYGPKSEDAELIILARNHLPEVLDYISRLEKVVEAAEELANSYMGVAGDRFRFVLSPTKLRNALAALRKETK